MNLADLLSGGVTKASLVLVAEDKARGGLRFDELVFPINPEAVTFTDTAAPSRSENVGSGAPQKQGGSRQEREIKFKVHFDTYESREDVREKYIFKLQAFARPDPELHAEPKLLFRWGKLTYDTALSFPVKLEDLSVTYTMFLPDGTPVRCAVDLCLREATNAYEEGKQRNSPDHAKLHVVRRGDSLQQIAYSEYDDPREWRRIADANGIEDPMSLEPGSRLLVPPILR